MTPTQLRAFACVVRRGSVKGAAEELGTTESAVSMNLKQLRTELDDPLFTRTPSGLAFTPGGLRLASRAMEILDLQSRTVLEVSEAGAGRRMLRLASSRPVRRARGTRTDQPVHQPRARPRRRAQRAPGHRLRRPAGLARTVDVALGPAAPHTPRGLVQQTFLDYEVVVVAAPEHPVAAGTVGLDQLGDQVWHLGPGATEQAGETVDRAAVG